MPTAFFIVLIWLQLSWEVGRKNLWKIEDSQETGMRNRMKCKLALNTGTEIHSKAFCLGLEKTAVFVSLCKR